MRKQPKNQTTQYETREGKNAKKKSIPSTTDYVVLCVYVLRSIG